MGRGAWGHVVSGQSADNDAPDNDATPGLPTHGRGTGWLTACGQDRANVRYWTDEADAVTCPRCRVISPEKTDAQD